MANKVLIPRETVVFLKEETTRGTLVAPVAADALVIAGQGELNQGATYTDSEEIVGSRSLIDQFRDGIGAGEWSLPTYLRPSGTAGTAPQEAALWKGLLGAVADGASDVIYTPAVTLPTFSLWMKVSNIVLFAAGLTVNKVDVKGAKKGAVTAGWGGKFLKLGWCGETVTDEAIDGTPVAVDHVKVLNPKVISVGARIKVGDHDNTGAGYTVTAVSLTTGDVTVTPSFDFDETTAAAVVPVLPAPTFVGDPVEGRQRALSVASVATTYREFSLSIENGIDYLEDEVNAATEYPSDFVEGPRKVSGSFNTVFRTNELFRFSDGLGGSEVTLSWAPSSDVVAGKKVTIALGKAKLQTPKIGDAGPARGLESAFTALATSGEDEITVTYA